MQFQKKQLSNAKRVCIRLKEAREAAGFSIEQITQKTKIRPEYIKALESCNFEKLPKGMIYQKQIIKAYSKTIGIDCTSYIFQFCTEESKQKESKNIIPTKPKRSYFHDIPSVLRYASLIAVCFITVGYLTMQIQKIVQPPSLVLHSPQNGLVTYTSGLEVSGNTGKEVFVSINGKNIPNNGSGNFNEKIDLSNGVNTIVVSANRKHGKSTTITRHVILKDDNQLSLKN
jgi:hypothetical protein